MSPASLVPSLDVDVHLVLCDFGRSGLAYVETDPTTKIREVAQREGRDLTSGTRAFIEAHSQRTIPTFW